MIKVWPQSPDPPFLLASTLLVPGYVDEREVEAIAGFIAGLNPEIPYSLLAFYPHFYLHDLPTTSRRHAIRCKEVAERKGLRRVHIGNVHLLSEDYWKVGFIGARSMMQLVWGIGVVDYVE